MHSQSCPRKSEILVVEDDAVLSRLIAHQLKRMGYDAHAVHCWAEVEGYMSEHEPDLIILDPKLPDADGYELLPQLALHRPVIVLTAYGSVQSAVRAIKAGAAEYLVKPVNLEQLELEVARVLETDMLRRDHQFYRDHVRALRRGPLIGESAAVREVKELIDAVAPSDMTVLVQGESGVGKELIATAIHERSRRCNGNLITVDCGTLHESLFEAELFGHERGAFTGADQQKKGLVEVADGGTLFLDEIAEIAPATEAKLLRLLESGRFRRLGGNKNLPTDVRMVAATTHDLQQDTENGQFRSDLYYRLSAFSIRVPPLRERREDVPLLIDHFLHDHNLPIRSNKCVSPVAMRQLMAYDWPGNVRELRNVVERALIISGSSTELRPEHFPRLVCATNDDSAVTLTFDHEPTLDELEKSYLELLLSKHGGHRSAIAETLGVAERTIYRRLRRYGY